MATIKNASTSVDYWKTLGEIHMALSRGGATHVNVRHEGGAPVGISFAIEIDHFPLNFVLPCQVTGIAEILRRSKEGGNRRGAASFDEKVLRVGWRIIKDWIDAQIAFIEAQKAEDRLRALATVFLPYATNINGETLADRLLKPENLKQLGAGS